MSLLETPQTENTETTAEATTPETGEQSTPAEALTAETSTEELLGGKYKTAADLEKGYKSQSKHIGELRQSIKEYEQKYAVPEDYDFNFKEGGQLEKYQALEEQLDLPYLGEVFKKNGLTKDQATGVLESYLESIEAAKPKPEDELAKLGYRKEQVLGELNQYKQGLNEQDQKLLDTLAISGEALDFLHRHLVSEKLTIPTNTTAVPGKSVQELKDEATAYRKEYGHLFDADEGKRNHYLGLQRKAFAAAGVQLDN